MRIPATCRSCGKTRRMQVSGHELSSIASGRPPTGVCDECADPSPRDRYGTPVHVRDTVTVTVRIAAPFDGSAATVERLHGNLATVRDRQGHAATVSAVNLKVETRTR